LAVVCNPFFFIMSYLTFALFMREIHFEGAKMFCYFSLAGVAYWFWLWRERIQDQTNDRQLMSWFALTLAAYCWAQMASRRWLQFIPGEETFQTALEEGFEDVAHILMMITGLAGKWKK